MPGMEISVVITVANKPLKTPACKMLIDIREGKQQNRKCPKRLMEKVVSSLKLVTVQRKRQECLLVGHCNTER